MALSALNWRMLTPRNIPVGYTIFNWLDIVYAMGTDTTYADGTARVPGTGSAWTWTRDTTLVLGSTTACIGVPPINALGMAYIVAGDNVNRAPVMNTDAAYTGGNVNAPIIAMNKNSGVYNSWVAANPMTTGQFSGFVRAPTIATFSGGAFPQTLIMWECQEAFFLAWNRTDVAAQSVIGAGALIDPLSGAAANAETDGRLYSVATSGASSYMASTWLGTGAGWLNSSVSAGTEHLFTFNVGAVATTRNTPKIGSFTTTSGSFVAPNGEVPNVPLSAYFSTSGQYAGQFRQIGVTKFGTTGAEWDVSGVRKGYTMSSSAQSVGATILLSY
jgi:hypothetical protein